MHRLKGMPLVDLTGIFGRRARTKGKEGWVELESFLTKS